MNIDNDQVEDSSSNNTAISSGLFKKNTVLSDFFTTTRVRRCNWCYNLIKDCNGNEVLSGNCWCSTDCKEEEEDWNFLKKLMKAREVSRKVWREKHPIKKIAMNRTEYLKRYHLEHKEKRQQQFKEQRIKRLNKQ